MKENAPMMHLKFANLDDSLITLVYIPYLTDTPIHYDQHIASPLRRARLSSVTLEMALVRPRPSSSNKAQKLWLRDPKRCQSPSPLLSQSTTFRREACGVELLCLVGRPFPRLVEPTTLKASRQTKENMEALTAPTILV